MRMNSEETAIIKEAQRGNLLAFETLVKRYDRHVMQLAYSMVGNAEDAEDIYQEVFVRVYRSLARFQFKSEFSTWLYRVVVNYCINFQKKKQRTRMYSIDKNDYEDQHWKVTLPGKEKNPEDNTINLELSCEIEAAMDQLPAKQKMVFVLRHFHGHKLREIAALMGCTEGTVKSYLFRATQKMQMLLKEYSTS